MQSIAYLPASNQSANASLMTVTNIRAALASTIKVNTVANVPAKFAGSMGTPHNFTDPVTGETITIISEASAVDFFGSVSGSDIVIDQIAAGYTDLGSKVGDIIVIKPITEDKNNLYNILKQEHKDDGKHGVVTADSVTLNDGTVLGGQTLFANGIINGGCLVGQRTVIPSLSTTYQYGKVDRFAAKATGTAVSAGTIDQALTALAAIKGADVKLAGVTLTGTGIVYLRYRMEAKDAQMWKNAIASFTARVYHDVGSSINATIFVRKANAADNFTAVTDIANSGAIAVPNTTSTLLKFENINAGSLGDVSNGIEIEIQIACGAVTTKNFYFGELSLNRGAKASPFQPRPIQTETALCQRYYLQVRDTHQGYSGFATGFVGSPTFQVATPVTMRTAPTLTWATCGVRYGGSDFGFSACVVENMSSQGVSCLATAPGVANGNVGAIWSANGKFYFDAEL